MGLLETLVRRNVVVAVTKRCKLGEILDSLDEDTQAAMIVFIDNARTERDTTPQSQRIFTLRWLEKALNDNGYIIGRTVLAEHIGERCACDTGK